MVNYSNTIIYKICCKDSNIKDLYVGHTTNFINRLKQHRDACNKDNKLKLYKTINENGGWNNWDMIELEKYSCSNLSEAKIKEQEYYNKLNATLNSCPPYIDKQNYFCLTCNLQLLNEKLYNKHLQTKNHYNKLNNISNKEELTIHSKFNCDLCNFNCNKQSDWDRHILRKKHILLLKNNMLTIKKHNCNICNKNFSHRQSLSIHKKNCLLNESASEKNIKETNKNCIQQILDYQKETLELQKEMFCKIIKLIKSKP